MEERIVETPNGYKVYLRPFLKYKDYISLQKLYTSHYVLGPDGKPKANDISANVVYEANEKAVEFLLIKIEDKAGQVLKEKVGDLPVEDGAAVMEIIDEISTKAAESVSKKKLMKP